MKRSVSIQAAGIGVLAALLIGGIGSFVLVPKLGYEFGTYPVKLDPDNSTNELHVEVKDDKKKCRKTDNAGCLLFEKDKVGTVKFYLDGSKFKNHSCANKDKVITKIELSTVGADDKGKFEGDAGWTAPDKWLKENAFPSVDLTTGIAYKPDTLNEARTQVLLSNLNNHDQEIGTKSFWYKITVADCDGDDGPWVSDPRGDNKGTNY